MTNYFICAGPTQSKLSGMDSVVFFDLLFIYSIMLTYAVVDVVFFVFSPPSLFPLLQGPIDPFEWQE